MNDDVRLTSSALNDVAVVINVTSDQDDLAFSTLESANYYRGSLTLWPSSGGYQCKSQSVTWGPLTSRWCEPCACMSARRRGWSRPDQISDCSVVCHSSVGNASSYVRTVRRTTLIVHDTATTYGCHGYTKPMPRSNYLTECSVSNLHSNLPDADATSSLKAVSLLRELALMLRWQPIRNRSIEPGN